MSDFIKRVVVEGAGSSSENTYAEHVELVNADGTPFAGSGSAEIDDGSVTTAKIADGAVTAEKIASGVIPEAYTLPAATSGAIGGVRQATHVASAAGENVTQAEFEALLDALEAAGIVAGA